MTSEKIKHLETVRARLTEKQQAQVKAFQELAGSMVAGILLGDIKEQSLNLVIKDSDGENPVSAIIIPGSIEDLMPNKMN